MDVRSSKRFQWLTAFSRFTMVLYYLVALLAFPVSILGQNDTCSMHFAGYDGSCMVQSYHWDGDVTFGLMGNLHESAPDGVWCDRISTTYVETAALVKWLLGKLSDTEYIKGVQFGLRLMDSCRHTEHVARGLLSFVPDLETADCGETHVVGILDHQTSDQSVVLATALNHTQIPVLSSTSTAPSLSDKSRYSTFLRTISSDVVSVEAIRDIVLALKMYYIAIIHTTDSYGIQGVEKLREQFKGTNVCIASVSGVRVGDSASFQTAMGRLEENLEKVGEQQIMGVVYFGQYQEARELVQWVDDLENNMGRQFIWIMCEAVGLETSLYIGHEHIGRNALSLSPVSLSIADFSTFYWLPKLEEYLEDDDLEDDFYYREYIEELLNCRFAPGALTQCQDMTKTDIENSYVEPGYFLVVMDAVYAFAYATKKLHTLKCGADYDGVCATMRTALNDDFLNNVKQVDFTYPSDFTYIPAVIRSQARRIAFDSNGDPIRGVSSPSYHIHQYQCHSGCFFVTVSIFPVDDLVTNIASRDFYPYPFSDEAVQAADLGPIICTVSCLECNVGEIEFAYIAGEFLVAALLPFHDPLEEFLACNYSSFRSRMGHTSEAILYAVDVFNNNNGIYRDHPLSGKLGAIIFNSCHDGIFSFHQVAEFHSGTLLLRDPDGQIIDPDRIVAYIGGHYSSTNLEVATIISSLNLPQLAYAATSVSLFNYPHILRTIPADDVQARVIIEVVKSMGWQQIAILYQDDAYGLAGFEALSYYAAQGHICIPTATPVPVLLDEGQVINIISRLFDGNNIEVVVLFMGYDEILTLLKEVTDIWGSTKRFLWIGSEAWGRNEEHLESATALQALGAITVFPEIPNLPDLQTYFRNLRPETNQRNPFFSHWWEDHFQCGLFNSNTGAYGLTLCASDLILESSFSVNAVSQLTVPAVLTVAIGLGEALITEDICGGFVENCPAIREKSNLYKIIEHIKDVSLTTEGSSQPSRVYTDRGDGNLNYIVTNIQVDPNDPDDYIYVEVGEFNPTSGLIMDPNDVLFYDDNGQTVTVSGACQTNCQNCSDDQDIHHSTLDSNGTVSLFVILDMHDSQTSVGISPESLKTLETFLLAVDEVNRDGDILPSLTLGYHIRDSHSDVNVGSYYALTTLISLPACFEQVDGIDNVVAYMTTGPDDVARGVIDITQSHHRFHIDTQVSVSSVFPPQAPNNFFVPVSYSSAALANAMVSALHAMEIYYLGVIYSDDFLMEDTYQQLQQSAEKHELCIISTLKLHAGATTDYNSGLLVSWLSSDPSASLIIVLTDLSLAEFMLERIENLLSTGSFREGQAPLLFMGGEELSGAITALSSSFKRVFHNAITVTPPKRTPSQLGQNLVSALTALDVTDEERNPWFDEDTWELVQNSLSRDTYDHTVEATLAAVMAFAKGLTDYLQDSCVDNIDTCIESLQTDIEAVTQLKVKVETQLRSFPAYVQHLDVNLYSYSMSTDDLAFQKIGSYNIANSIFQFANGGEEMGLAITECPDQSICGSCRSSDGHVITTWMIVVVAVVLILFILLIAMTATCLCKRRRNAVKEKVLSSNGQDSFPKRDRTDPLPHTPANSDNIQYVQGSTSSDGHFRLTPISHRRDGDCETTTTEVFPTTGISADNSGTEYYLPASSTSSGQNDEIIKFMFDHGSQCYYYNSNLDGMPTTFGRGSGQSRHGGDPSLLDPHYRQLQHEGTYGVSHPPSISITSSHSSPSLVISDPKLIQNILEGVRISSPGHYQEYVRKNNGSVLSRQCYAFDNPSFSRAESADYLPYDHDRMPSNPQRVAIGSEAIINQRPSPAPVVSADQLQSGKPPLLHTPRDELVRGDTSHVYGPSGTDTRASSRGPGVQLGSARDPSEKAVPRGSPYHNTADIGPRTSPNVKTAADTEVRTSPDNSAPAENEIRVSPYKANHLGSGSWDSNSQLLQKSPAAPNLVFVPAKGPDDSYSSHNSSGEVPHLLHYSEETSLPSRNDQISVGEVSPPPGHVEDGSDKPPTRPKLPPRPKKTKLQSPIGNGPVTLNDKPDPYLMRPVPQQLSQNGVSTSPTAGELEGNYTRTFEQDMVVQPENVTSV